MLCNIGKWGVLSQKCLSFATNIRYMTTTEVSTALRPFYFSVHPDLFGQHPDQRSINENSLKQLSSFIECLQSHRSITPCNLQFYLRDKKSKQDSFRLIKIHLYERNLRATVLTILKSCDLPTEYVDKIPEVAETPVSTKQFVKTNTKMDQNIDFSTLEDDPIFGAFIVRKKVKDFKDTLTLRNWINKNYKSALELSEKYQSLREEVARLKNVILEQWGVLDVRRECGWNEQHFRGCLQSFKEMSEQYPKSMCVLKGRILVFGSFTGVTIDGHIMLNSGEVRHNWLDLLKNIKMYDAVLCRIPAFEKALSQVLLEIRIVRRKFMPKVLAGDYERNLQQLTTNVSDYLSRRSYPDHWPKSLKEYEIVVETEAGPLMVSPTGQFIAPASCPGFLLVKFLSENMDEAAKSMENYKRNKHVERSLHKGCVNELELTALYKDDNITPDFMIQCCEQLLKHKDDLQNLRGVLLNITTYYSVLRDGMVCIPWDWKL